MGVRLGVVSALPFALIDVFASFKAGHGTDTDTSEHGSKSGPPVTLVTTVYTGTHTSRDDSGSDCVCLHPPCQMPFASLHACGLSLFELIPQWYYYNDCNSETYTFMTSPPANPGRL